MKIGCKQKRCGDLLALKTADHKVQHAITKQCNHRPDLSTFPDRSVDDSPAFAGLLYEPHPSGSLQTPHRFGPVCTLRETRGSVVCPLQKSSLFRGSFLPKFAPEAVELVEKARKEP